MLVIENLVKRYGKFKAVDGLSLEIDKGHIYGFVGPNGAGKTTTMKIIAGLLKPTQGRVIVNGTDVSVDPRGVKRKIGYMPDFFGVYDDLKVTEYMNFYCGVYHIPRPERRKITGQLLDLVDLSVKKDAYVDSLSRGMKQRLCLARSLIHNPELLILDEPASGLDPRARIEMKEILKELKGMGKTILISSHILPELAEVCSSIGIIEHGKMVVSGTVDEILKKTAKKKTIRIRTLDNLESALKYIEEQPSMSGISINSDFIDADFDGNSQILSEILKGMVMNGIPVTSFSELEGSLESVFMHLTEGGIQDAS
ncbi:MAG: ABC transporter ATP-binding protein [Bacillota bacterium]|nr:ABC transporter ATP-binding protein [Bacillota bacterium]